MVKKILFVFVLYFSIFSVCLNFNCRKSTNDICGDNTMCNESGICVCNDFHFGESCEKKLPNLNSVNLNTGMSSGSFEALVLCLTLISPFSLILGLILIFAFLKGRDGTYIN